MDRSGDICSTPSTINYDILDMPNMSTVLARLMLTSAVVVILSLCSAPAVQTTTITMGLDDPFPGHVWIRSNLPAHIQHHLNEPQRTFHIAQVGARAYIHCVRYQLGCISDRIVTNPSLKGFYEAGVAMLTSDPLWGFEVRKWDIGVKEFAIEEGSQHSAIHDPHSTPVSHQPGEHAHPGRHRRETSTPGTTGHPHSTGDPSHVTHHPVGAEHHPGDNTTHSYPAEAQHWQMFFDFPGLFWGVVQHPGSVILSCYGTETDCLPSKGSFDPAAEPHNPPAEQPGSEKQAEAEYE